MPSKPTDVQFDIAVLWLQNNEGDGEEGEACRAVADWIEELRAQNTLRKVARKAGVPVAAVRKRLQIR